MNYIERLYHQHIIILIYCLTFIQKFEGRIARSLPNSVVVYGEKAVELCWYMNVQDVPVYMVPNNPQEFNPALYRAYTKSGKQLDYYVFPALKLHKEGGVLMKGVVQYKWWQDGLLM